MAKKFLTTHQLKEVCNATVFYVWKTKLYQKARIYYRETLQIQNSSTETEANSDDDLNKDKTILAKDGLV